MKRFFTLLITTLLFSAALCMTASASDYDAVAEDLSAIGMFRGTENGFELDRAPTRSEAAIMLVRLYGAEDAAKAAYEAGEISHPFTDVSAFTSPYVAWLYTNGITNGFTETTYASQRPCTAQNYTVFLLRALGYQDDTDFVYADALTFAQEKGFYNPLLFSGEFLRDDLAALTYQALAADMAHGDTYLLDSLIQSNAIDQTSAKPMTDKMVAYRAMQEACADLESDRMDTDIAMKMDMTMGMEGFSQATSMETLGTMQIIADDPTDIQMAYEMRTNGTPMDMEIGMWLKDGWEYMSMTMAGETMKTKSPSDDSDAVMEELEIVDVSSMDVSDLVLIDSISSKSVSGGTEYTVTFTEGLGGAMDSVASLLDDPEINDANMEISSIHAVYTIDRTGNLKNIAMVFSASMMADMPMEDGTVIALMIGYDYDMNLTINAVGNKVRISWPDFSQFQEEPALMPQ